MRSAVGESFVVCLLVLAPLATSARAEVAIETIALAGQSAVGVPGDLAFTGFEDAAAHATGGIAFVGAYSGGHGVWVDDGGGLRLVARIGETAPGTGDPFSAAAFAYGLTIDGSGHAGFEAFTSPDTLNGFWADGIEDLEIALYEGDTPPQVGVSWSDFPSEFAWAGGFAAFEGVANVPTEDVHVLDQRGAVWRGVPGNTPQLVAFNLDPSPIVTQLFLSFQDVWINASGVVAFEFDTTPALIDAIAVGGAGGLDVAASTGTPAPGTNGNFTAVGILGLTDAGHACLRGSTNASGAATSGYWIWDGDGLQPVAIAGMAAPGVADATLPVLDTQMACAGDTVAFHAQLAGPGIGGTNFDGLWAGIDGDIQLVARRGDPAPGTGDGVQFGGFPSYTFFVNASGVVAFVASLVGSGVNGSNDRGVWMGRAGEIELVAREGNPIPIAPGDSRTLSSFDIGTGFGASQGGYRSALDDSNRLVFVASSPQGAALLAATIAVPESDAGRGCAALAALALARLATRRSPHSRKRRHAHE